jgi:hypothetical protein
MPEDGVLDKLNAVSTAKRLANMVPMFFYYTRGVLNLV